jgi:hypothetical protein
LSNVGEGPYIPHVFGDEVQERLKRGLSWLTAAVHHSISWPSHDVLVHYDGEDYYLRVFICIENCPRICTENCPTLIA